MKFDHLHPITGALLIPALIPLGGLWVVAVIALFAFLQFSFFRHQVHLHRELIFSTYIAEESPLMKLRPYTFFVRLMAGGLAIAFSIFTFLGVFCSGWVGAFAICVGASFGAFLGEKMSASWLGHARSTVRAYYSLRWTFGVSLFFAVLTFVAADLITSLDNYGGLDAPTMAGRIVDSTKHSSKWVQDIARTLDYVHYTKLRLRDSIPYGWLIYIFMVIPNVFPICGAVAAMFGATMVGNKIRNNEELSAL